MSSYSRLGAGYMPNGGPKPPAYEPSIVTGTTEAILDLRRQIGQIDRHVSQKAKGRLHWSNIPSGGDITNEFNRKYPRCKISPNNYGPISFPYPSKSSALPSSSFVTSQTSQINMSHHQYPVVHQHKHHHHYEEVSDSDDGDYSSSQEYEYDEEYDYDDEEYDDGASESDDEEENDDRINRALKHIEHASHILETY